MGIISSELCFAIILVHYKGVQDTTNCINSLIQLNYKRYEVVVIDNSDEPSEEYNLSECLNYNKDKIIINDETLIRETGLVYYKDEAKVTISKLKSKNRGFAAANNLGICYLNINQANYDWLWLLNNDTEVEIDLLIKINNFIQSSLTINVGMLGCDIFNFYNKNEMQGIGCRMNRFSFSGIEIYTENYSEEECNNLFYKYVDYIIGASMFVNRRFIDDVGLMNEVYFLYYEEIDWAIRGKRKGWKLGYCHGAKVYHKIGATIGSGDGPKSKSDISDFYGIRNKIIFVKQYYPFKYPLLVVSLFISICKRVFYRQYNRAFRIPRIFLVETFTNRHAKFQINS